MRFVLIDSPGPGPGEHWSAAFVRGLAARLRAAAADVVCLSGSAAARAPLHRVAAGCSDLAAEVALARALRGAPADAVLHAGVGARGSANLLWLASRMGSVAVAVVRAPEAICHRGDLVTRDGSPCAEFDSPARCAGCCRRGWRRVPARDFQNRLDLVVSGLQECASVWLDPGCAGSANVDRLVAAGVPRRALRTAADPVTAVAAELGALSAPSSPTSS